MRHTIQQQCDLLAKATFPVFLGIHARGEKQPGAHEALVRGKPGAKQSSAHDIFSVARKHGFEGLLSATLREKALDACGASRQTLFLNVASPEIGNEDFIPSVARLRNLNPTKNIVLEFHESTKLDHEGVPLYWLRKLKDPLQELNVSLALDDFGAGMDRLSAIFSAEFHYIKFDMALIRHLDLKPLRFRRGLQCLLELTHSHGAIAIAEGVQSAGEAEACWDLGFDLEQGFFFGHPVPAERDSTFSLRHPAVFAPQ